jgi:adenylate cyclase
MSFFQELKRRNVVRMGIAYGVVAWVLLQFIDFALDVIDAPGWILQVFVLVAAIGLPIVLIFSWVFELTPDGLKRESEIDRSRSITPQTGRKIDRIIITALALAVVLLLVERFISMPGKEAEKGSEPFSVQQDPRAAAAEKGSDPVSETIAEPAERSVAVLPFHAMSSGEDDEYFADGLTEEILNSLAQLPELLVTARTSSFAFKGQDRPVQEIARELNVRHVVEGSVRRSGDRLRVTAQLIRAADGFHLWSENYDSTEQDTIAVQEDIAEKIAQALDVVLDESKREAMRLAGLRDVPAFIALQKANELYEEAHGSGDQITLLRKANGYYDQVLERVPSNNTARRDRTDLYVHLLINDATGSLGVGEATEEELAAAYPAAIADTELAIAHATDDYERFNAEFDLAFMSSDWNGMAARVERFLAQDGCDWPVWIDNIGIPMGYADRLGESMERRVNCDPLTSSSWQALVRALLWAGKPEAAREWAQQGMQRAPGSWLIMQQTAVLIAMGRYDEAISALDSQVLPDLWNTHNRLMIAAAQVDEPAIERWLENYEANAPGDERYFGLMYNAWLGRTERANELAAKVDEYVFGSPALATITLWCNCGAPFDLEATPKFAADVKESGMPWPPFAPIHFPLKEGVAQIRTTP